MMVKIGVLTSGGDSQGMNAAIYSVVKMAISKGHEVIGIQKGYYGVINKLFVSLKERNVDGIIHKGGTILQSARCEEFKTQEGQEKGIQNLRSEGIEHLIVIGGDGSYNGALALYKQGINTYGLPGTIDNDIPLTDYTIGFDTTVNIVTNLINNIRDTSSSHERTSVIEVMGRNCGDIALHAGLGCGVDAVIIPEFPHSIEDICKRIESGFKKGKKCGIVIVAEGAGSAIELAKTLQEKTGLEVRGTVLGHIQRGGYPSNFDRLFTIRLASKVMELIEGDIAGVALGIENNEITYHKIEKVLKSKNQKKEEYYEMVNILSI